MTEQIKNQIQNVSRLEQKIFFGLIAILFILFSIYGFLLKTTVHNIVLRENFGKERATLVSHVADLNANYIALKNSITLEVAYSRGFKPASEPHFISKQNTAKTLSFNNAI
ncbi:hypothetical protein EPO17_00785 [Patescibacteria group bacterium]|nr:MAG: hypothetical protein EPO17_00785 [Patescibacteria group bacterium]